MLSRVDSLRIWNTLAKVCLTSDSPLMVRLSRCKVALIVALLASTISLAHHVNAHEYSINSIDVLHPYAAPTPPGATIAAGYMGITNHGQREDRLLGGFADFAKAIEVHRTLIEDDVAKMRKLEQGLLLPAGSTVNLAPSGTHLMLVGITKELTVGERVSVTLFFEHAGQVKVELSIEHVDVQNPMDHSAM